MTTAIVGAGAMGCLFGGLLAESGEEVRLIDVWEAHVQAIRRSGLSVEREGRTRIIRIPAVPASEAAGPADLVIVFVKSTHTREAASLAARIAASDGVLLTLQNGLGNAEILAEAAGPERVLAGTTAHGATLLSPGCIRHAGTGPTVIGPWDGKNMAAARNAARTLALAGIAAEVQTDVRSLLWDKLLVNVGINAVTALTGILNGRIPYLDDTRRLTAAAVEEAAAVARASGVTVRDNPVAHVLSVAEKTARNRSSMGQDVDHRRPTEIAAINGAVVREAEKQGIAVPVNQTLTALIRTLEAHYAESVGRQGDRK